MLVIPSLTGLCIKLLVRLGREETISDILPEDVAPELHKAIQLYIRAHFLTLTVCQVQGESRISEL